MAQWVKNLPGIRETEELQVRSLGGEDPVEEEMATHSSILAQRIPWAEEPTAHGVTESDTTEQLKTHTHTLENQQHLLPSGCRAKWARFEEIVF